MHGHADGVHVRRGARDQAGRGEPVDIGEGKALNFFKQHRAQVLCKALAGNGGAACAEQTEDHRYACDEHHDPADGQHETVSLRDKRIRKQPAQHEIVLAVKTAVDDDRHQHGDENLQHDFQAAEYGGGDGPALIAAQAFFQMPERFLLRLLFDMLIPLPVIA